MGIIDSQKVPDQRFLGLNKFEDLPVLANEYKKVDSTILEWKKISSLEQPKVLKGYRARFYPENFVDSSGNIIVNSSENAFKPHGGTAITRNRFGYGGPSGQPVVSSGFGQTAEEATRVAAIEVKSYGGDPSKLKLAIEPLELDSSKVLDFRDPKTKFIFEDKKILGDLLLRRANPSSYTLPNMLGHSAKSNGVEMIILYSEPDLKLGSGFNIHTVGSYGN